MKNVNLTNCEILSLSNIVAIYLSQNLSCDEIDFLGSFLQLVGQNLIFLSLRYDNSSQIDTEKNNT